METAQVWYKLLDWSMIWVCLGSIITLSLFMALNPEKDKETAKSNIMGVGNFFMNTWKNHLYNLFAGFVMLSFISEIGFPLLNSFLQLDFEVAEGARHFLASMSGIGGGFVLAKIIRLFKKI